MKKIIKFIKAEPILSLASIAAIISAFIVPPDIAYVFYCNFEVLSILFCLMLVVAGFKHCNVFEMLTYKLRSKIKSEKYMILCLTLVCFFSSALITNDVALITFVPFSIALLSKQNTKSVIFAVTMETVAANLGSLITPIGNPQNLYLYSFYNMTIGDFLSTAVPLGIICLAMITVTLMLRKNAPLNKSDDKSKVELKLKPLVMFVILFAVCLLSVLKIVPWYISLVLCCVCTFLQNKKLFKEADYILLITFVCFFILVGNIARIEAVHTAVSKIIDSRELIVSALLSQVISNVPAAAMLSSFTNNAPELILGCNIGGLGTLIASMASLISYRQVCKSGIADKTKYLVYFTSVNLIMLAVLLWLYTFVL